MSVRLSPSGGGERNIRSIPALFIQDGHVVDSLKGTIAVLSDAGYNDEELIIWLFTPDESLRGGAPLTPCARGGVRQRSGAAPSHWPGNSAPERAGHNADDGGDSPPSSLHVVFVLALPAGQAARLTAASASWRNATSGTSSRGGRRSRLRRPYRLALRSATPWPPSAALNHDAPYFSYLVLAKVRLAEHAVKEVCFARRCLVDGKTNQHGAFAFPEVIPRRACRSFRDRQRRPGRRPAFGKPHPVVGKTPSSR